MQIIEGNVLNRWLIHVRSNRPQESFHGFIGFGWETMRQGSRPNHQADDFVGGQIFASLRRDPLTIAHHRHIVSNFQNSSILCERMMPTPRSFECVDDAEQMRHFLSHEEVAAFKYFE